MKKLIQKVYSTQALISYIQQEAAKHNDEKILSLLELAKTQLDDIKLIHPEIWVSDRIDLQREN